MCGETSLTPVRLSVCCICILKVTCKRFLANTAALKVVASTLTQDLTLVALILAALCSSRQQIMESGSDGQGRGGGVMDVEIWDALQH